MPPALVVTSAGWARSAFDASYVGQVAGCRWADDLLMVTFTYGANEEVSPVRDTRDGHLVVSLETRSGGTGRQVLHPDGSELASD